MLEDQAGDEYKEGMWTFTLIWQINCKEKQNVMQKTKKNKKKQENWENKKYLIVLHIEIKITNI